MRLLHVCEFLWSNNEKFAAPTGACMREGGSLGLEELASVSQCQVIGVQTVIAVPGNESRSSQGQYDGKQ